MAGLLDAARERTGPEASKIIPTAIDHPRTPGQVKIDEEIVRTATEDAQRTVEDASDLSPDPQHLIEMLARSADLAAERARRSLLESTVRAQVLRHALTRSEDDQSSGDPSSPNEDDQS